MSSSGISWAICKSASRPRQITTTTPHHSVFLQVGCPSCRPTNSVKALKGFQSTEGILPTCHRERKRNLVQAEFVLIRRSLCKFVWNWVPKLLRWVGKLSYYRVCGALCLWRTICRLGSDVAVLAGRYDLVVVVYFDAADPLLFYGS